MKTVYLVEVGDTPFPRFPELCVVCCQPGIEPLTTITIGDEAPIVDFGFYKIIKQHSSGALLEIPIHDSCAKSLRNRLLKQAVLFLLALAILIFGGFYLDVSFWFTIFAALAIIIPFVSIQLSNPPPVEFGHGGGQYLLMFSSAQYAGEFARIHDAKIIEAGYRGGDYSRKTSRHGG